MAGPVNRDSDKVIVRLPDGMRDRIKAAAESNGRSMNSEIVSVLKAHYSTNIDRLPPEMQRRLGSGETPLSIWMDHSNMSTIDLANATGLPRHAIANIRLGHAFGSVRVMKKIADALDITVDDLLYNPDF